MPNPTMFVFRNLIRQSITVVVRERFRVILDRAISLQGGRDFGVPLFIRHAIGLCVMHQTRRLNERFQLVPEQSC